MNFKIIIPISVKKNYICIFFPFIFISWRLITLQYCSGFCHTLVLIAIAFQVALVIMNLSACANSIRHMGLISGSGRSPGGGRGTSLQYSCLENPTDRRAWQAIVHRVSKSQTQLKRLSMHSDCTEPIDCFRWYGHFNSIKPILINNLII